MILLAVFQLNSLEIFAGKYENMIVTDTYRVFFFIALCLIGIYYVLVNRKGFNKPGPMVYDYFALIFISFTGIAVIASFNKIGRAHSELQSRGHLVCLLLP